MDGNGRWALERGLPRERGHAAGAKALREIVEAAPAMGIRNLTVFAFSADNWQRPESERAGLFKLFERYFRDEISRCAEEGVELRCLGWRHRLPASLQTAIADAERLTAHGKTLTLRVAIDYSSRALLAHAAALSGASAEWPPAPLSRPAMDYALAVAYGQPGRKVPAVDLLIRTGGEQRLSDFLLWECAYAELWFTPTLWPDFRRESMELALADFHARTRTFGGLAPAIAVESVLAAGSRR
ncbi:MAG: di-trans,poly-cis-decaprenylcistransferase [Bryobacterales bacterium]|nr:di-trans,poly-cis-decaprenylcistransferase [Bryobacterales bacterium]